jgi:hypothetical protein
MPLSSSRPFHRVFFRRVGHWVVLLTGGSMLLLDSVPHVMQRARVERALCRRLLMSSAFDICRWSRFNDKILCFYLYFLTE